MKEIRYEEVMDELRKISGVIIYRYVFTILWSKQEAF